MNEQKKITRKQLKVVFGLCDDLKPHEIAEKLDMPLSEVEQSVIELKQIYNVKTLSGLIYQHYITNQEVADGTE